MASIYKDNAYTSRSESGIAANSAALVAGDFVQTGATGIVAATTSGKIAGMSNGTKTFASDNFTVAKDIASYTVADKGTLFKIVITGGTVTIADEGVSYYNLATKTTIDGTTESAVGQYIDTTSAASVDALVSMQFKLVKFISATVGIFEAV